MRWLAKHLEHLTSAPDLADAMTVDLNNVARLWLVVVHEGILAPSPGSAIGRTTDPRCGFLPDLHQEPCWHTQRVYRFAEHGGEVELELESADEAGIFAAALAAFAELVSEGNHGDVVEHEVELREDDRALLLADWLNELVFLADVERFVPQRLEAFELAHDRLRATLAGRRGQPRQLVKAVTLNSLEFGREGGVWHGRVVLDV